MKASSRIYVAGHRGLVGSAISRKLKADGFRNITTRTRSDLDLTDQKAVEKFFKAERPQYVFMAAAKVGGIQANNGYPAEFIRDNILIQTNIIDQAWRYKVKKVLFLGSSCIYPRMAPQPMKEEYLLNSALEPTNQWYAIAKIAGIKMCQAYRRQYGLNAICCMPTNLYGPNDNFDLNTGHVLPALIRKFHEAKINENEQAVIWGTGTPKREFLYVGDLADACLCLMDKYESSEIINVGTGKEISIGELAELVAQIVGYQGKLVFDSTKPDGTPRKLLDTSRINALGWKSLIDLKTGIDYTYEWFKNNLPIPN